MNRDEKVLSFNGIPSAKEHIRMFPANQDRVLFDALERYSKFLESERERIIKLRDSGAKGTNYEPRDYDAEAENLLREIQICTALFCIRNERAKFGLVYPYI
jgi:hypothetical protein